MRTVYWDKPVDFDGRLIFGPMEAHKSMMGASWVTIRDRPFAAAANSINDALNGRVSPDFARELFETALKSRRHIRLQLKQQRSVL
ncbi:DUF982 domain-containing protein (plasmid) [Aliirhizobium terrae]|uniref:DUF982 domain-containing protein n=1 Tax=Terrirhizobium terrae TaxID=2926709 RepID=UPI0025750FEC|nr:DUF982 domain-containing protein [Rhizobium sp. CC-CFT758]WJH38789.1 DUF982 domain-containing protein [Rhizobium sp. CC-CFT758]